MFEDSRTQLFVCNVTNADAASYAVLKALAGSAGAFYYEPQTFTETALATNATLVHRFAFRNTRGQLSTTLPFKSAQVKNGGYYAYLARQEQVSYLGYNGTFSIEYEGEDDKKQGLINSYYNFKKIYDWRYSNVKQTIGNERY
jgi:hypothetical protein